MARQRRLPPMNALKAFDAAARCGGFTAAGIELSVSPGAVSRHVANLEDYFGEPLFERHHNEIKLTPAGTRYHAQIRPALDVIEDASRWNIESSNPRLVHITTGPGLGRDWLLPRLPAFMKDNPNLELELSTGMSLIEEMNLELDDIDVIIHYSLSDVSSEHCDFLFETELQAVCSPSLPGLRTESDLYNQTLLNSLHSLTVWRQWFDVAGLEPPERPRSLQFGNGSLAIQAAAYGLGVALGETVCVANLIEEGRLVSPFPHRLRTGNKFFMTVNPARVDRPGVQAVRDWIRQQARECSPKESVTEEA